MPDRLTKLALIDDHKLFRKGMRSLIDMVSDNNYHIIFEADNGNDLQKKISRENAPDIALLDINMPGMDGFATVKWLTANYPKIKVLVVSMVENEECVIRMLKLGVKGYLSKDVEPDELRDALEAISNKGFYYTDFITGKLIHSLQNALNGNHPVSVAISELTDREKVFLHLACSELTYQEIAQEMFLSAKTVDGYRNTLFDKFGVKTRTGLALFAVRNGLVPL
jgi:two-component system, NarL family, invasion response regulator UvrY